MTLALVMLAGALGAPARFLIERGVARWTGHAFPWGTWIVNVSGSFALGVVAGLAMLRLNGDLSLTEKWKITFNSGYDLESKKFTQTFFSLNRELHCWQVSLGWTPFGTFQSYNFSIGVKSGLLSDLKLDRTRSFFDVR